MMSPSEIYYFQKYLYHKKWMCLARSLSRMNKILNGVDIGVEAQIGKNLIIHHGVGLVIGNAVKIGDNFTCFQNVTIGSKNLLLVEKNYTHRSPIICNNVTIYPLTVVAGPVTIGDGVVIGAHSLIMKDIPSGLKLPAGTSWI